MSQKSLARILSQLERFENPKLELEQYATPGEIAAQLLWTASMQGDIESRNVLDLGAGTGVLGIGALILGAHVTFVEKDPDAIAVLERNLAGYDGFTIVNADAAGFTGTFDTVVMNPPFGAQDRHADKRFLLAAFRSAKTVYSIHNANSTRFLKALCADHEKNYVVITHAHLSIPSAFEHHSKPRGSVDCILVRFR